MSRIATEAPLPLRYANPAGLDLISGTIQVPEARSPASGKRPGDRTLEIYYIVVKSLNPRPKPDPVYFLYGGPGGNSGALLRGLSDAALRDTFLSQRDLVVFDQRGTGFSTPNLVAPAADDAILSDLLNGCPAAERKDRFVAQMLAAHDRLIAEDINLMAINTHEIVADLDDLRRHLGHREINLFGISYGTRPALVAMRDYPGMLRSVVLDSVVPIQVNQFEAAIPNTALGFSLLFSKVLRHPTAARAYPELEAVFNSVFEKLNKNPQRIAVVDPRTRRQLEIKLTGELFVGILCAGFYGSQGIARMPYQIRMASQGNYDEIATAISSALAFFAPDGPRWAHGMYFSVNCCDDKLSPHSAGVIEELASDYPVYANLPLSEFHLGAQVGQIAAKWQARVPGPGEYAAAVSEVPALILAGELDQNTPAYWSRLAGESLPNSHYFEFAGIGHGVFNQGDCPAEIIKAFFDDPTKRPEDRCFDAWQKPDFFLGPSQVSRSVIAV